MLDSLIKSTEEIISKIINILPPAYLLATHFIPTKKTYDPIKDVFALFEISSMIYKYDQIVIIAKEYKVSFIKELNTALDRLKNAFYNISEKYIEDIALYLKNSSQLSKDIQILNYIPYSSKIIRTINDTHEYTIYKSELNYDNVMNISMLSTKIGITEEHIKLFTNIFNPKPIKPFTVTVSSNQFINIPNDLINEYFSTIELTPREIEGIIRLSDLELPAVIESNQDIEIYLYNYYMNIKEGILKKNVDISVWEFLKR